MAEIYTLIKVQENFEKQVFPIEYRDCPRFKNMNDAQCICFSKNGEVCIGLKEVRKKKPIFKYINHDKFLLQCNYEIIVSE